MARIPIIESQVAPHVGVPGVPRTGGVPDAFAGVGEGLATAASAIHQRDMREAAERAHQSRLLAQAAKEQERDEATLYVSNAMSAGRQAWTERLAKARESAPEDAAGFTDTALKDFDAWADEQVGAAPHHSKQPLKLHLNTLRDQIHRGSSEYEHAARYVNLQNQVDAGVDADARTVWTDAKQFDEVLARRLGGIAALSLPADKKAALAAKAKDAIAIAAAMGMAERDPAKVLDIMGFGGRQTGSRGKVRATPGGGAEMDGSSIFSMLPREKLEPVLHRAQTLVAQREGMRLMQAQAAAGEQKKAFEAAMGVLESGRALSPEFALQVSGRLKGTPYEAALRDMMAQGPQNVAVATKPIAVQRAELDALRSGANVRGSNPAVEKEIGRREKLLKAAESESDKDALTAANDRGVLPNLAPVSFTDMQSVPAQLAARAQQAGIAARWAGKPVSPLRADEAEGLAKSLMALPPDQRASSLAKIGQAVGDREQIGALARQIDAKDRTLATAMMYAGTSTQTRSTFMGIPYGPTQPGRLVSEIILKGEQARKDGRIKIDTAKETGWRAEIAKQIKDAYPNEQLRTHMIDAAVMVMAGLAADNDFASETASVDKAVRLATGGIRENADGTRVPLPYGMTPGDFEKALSAYPAQGDVYVGGQAIPAAKFVAGLPGASLVHAGQGKYAVRAGNGFVTDAKGNRIVLQF